MNESAILNNVLSELITRGILLENLEQQATQIVLFGSWAVGLQRLDSDIDLLCIGNGKRHKTPKVDIVWISTDFSQSKKWRSSELANHIIKYGKWIKGSNQWGTEIQISQHAIDFKRSLIRARSRGMLERWVNLPNDYQAKHAVKLRRDIQRLSILKQGNAVPASPQLDDMWVRTAGNLSPFLDSIGENELVPQLVIQNVQKFSNLQDWRTPR